MPTSLQAEFNKICDDTVTAMSAHVEPFSTPISMVLSDKHGKHLGTGYYLQHKDDIYLITNEHVAIKRNKYKLTYKFHCNCSLFSFNNVTIRVPAPIDVAVIKIDNDIWNGTYHKALAIPLSKFSTKHVPIQNEILFFAGFSGERSYFMIDTLTTRGTPYATYESPFPCGVEGADPMYHFSLFYPPELARSVDGTSSLPDAHGFSGSLVWNTKRIECLHNNIEWSPSMAEVTGIAWGWPKSSDCILATKVEHLHIYQLIEMATQVHKNEGTQCPALGK
jgi:hypothetical protein